MKSISMFLSINLAYDKLVGDCNKMAGGEGFSI